MTGSTRDVLVLQVSAGEGRAGLDQALEDVRSALAERPDRDVEVVLSEGVWTLGSPLEFGPRDGGGERATVTWTAATGSRVVWSGGRVLQDWRVEPDGTWSHDAPGPRNRELFVEGERMPRARFPREGWSRVVAPGPDGRTSFEFAEGDLAEWPDVSGAELHFLHDWSTSLVPIQAVDAASRTVQLEKKIGAWHEFFHITGFGAHPRYAVLNVEAGWTEPGDWLDDREAARIRYRPAPGATPSRTRAVLPELERLVTVSGSAEEPVQGLVFQGIVFAHSRGVDPPEGYAGIQAAFYEGRTGGEMGPEREVPVPVAVRVDHAQRVGFEGCRFEELGGSAAWLGKGTRDAWIRGCSVEDAGGNGLMVGELREPAPERPGDLARRIALDGNVVRSCGRSSLGAVGIWVGMAAEVSVRGNEVAHLPYTGISLGWIWSPRPSVSHGHRIEGNHIHHVMNALSDGGGIYTIGRHVDTFLRGNRIHDVSPNQGRSPNNGFFLDQGSSAFVVEGNDVRDIGGSPIRFHLAGDLVIRGNTLVHSADVGPFTYNACSPEGKVFEGNRILQASGAGDDTLR